MLAGALCVTVGVAPIHQWVPKMTITGLAAR